MAPTMAAVREPDERALIDASAPSVGRKRRATLADAARACFLIDVERRLLADANAAGRLLWGLGAGQVQLPLPLDVAMPAMVDLIEICRHRPAKQAGHDISLPLTFWTRRGMARWRCRVSPEPRRRGVLRVVPELLTSADVGARPHGFASDANGMGLLAHEVRTPLAAIQAFADLILMAADGEEADERLREYAGSIRQAAAMGLDIVSSILERTGPHATDASPAVRSAAIDAVARDVVRTMAPLVRQAGATISCDVPLGLPNARVNATALAQIVINLVGNALRHAGPRPRITLRAGKSGGQRVWIEVEDTGPGIPSPVVLAAAAAKPVSESPNKGFGLRTSIALARESGGALTIHSANPHGARVRVTFAQVGRNAAALPLVSEPI